MSNAPTPGSPDSPQRDPSRPGSPRTGEPQSWPPDADPAAGPIAPEPVAHGDRRDEVRYVDDPDGKVRASHLFPPDRPLPVQEDTPNAEALEDRGDQVGDQDVAELKPGPSAWDASPPDE